MCSNSEESKLNALIKTELKITKKPKTLIVEYGPYMNWGRWNANTSRIDAFLKLLLENGFNVQLQYEKDKLHYVNVKYNDEILFENKEIQHNKNYHNRISVFEDCCKNISKKLNTSNV